MALVQGIELRVGPGELHHCTDAAAHTAALGTGEVTRCVLGPGVYADHLECKASISIARPCTSPSTPISRWGPISDAPGHPDCD